MKSVQEELFDGFVRQRRCLCCHRRLHADPANRYRTRLMGLCFECLRDFERAGTWSVERFLIERCSGK